MSIHLDERHSMKKLLVAAAAAVRGCAPHSNSSLIPMACCRILASYSSCHLRTAGHPGARKLVLGYVHALSKRTSLYGIAARRAGIRKALYPNSVQYHGLDEPWLDPEPVNEESPARTTSPYGIGKNLCERLAREYNRLHGMEIVSVRVPGAYGPGVKIGARGVNLIGTAGALGQRVHFPYRPDLAVVLAHVDDIAEVAWRALASGRPPHDVYHIGDHYATYAELAAIDREHIPGMEVSFDETAPRICAYRIDSSRMTRALDVTHRSLEQGNEDLMNLTRAEHGLEPLHAAHAT